MSKHENKYDYRNVGLPIGTILGNELFIPYLEVELISSRFNGREFCINHYKFWKETSKTNQFTAYIPPKDGHFTDSYLKNPYNHIKKGELVRIDILSQVKVPFKTFTDEERFKSDLITFENMGIIKKKCYFEIYERFGLLDIFGELLLENIDNFNPVYQVSSKEDGSLDLDILDDGKKRRLDEIIRFSIVDLNILPSYSSGFF